MSCVRIGQVMFLPGGEKVQIERGLGDVDSDCNLVRAIPGAIPFLPMRARAPWGGATAQATVRACFQRPAATQLCDGVMSTQARSICRRLLRGWLRSQPRSSRRQIDRAWVLITPSQSWVAAGLWKQARTVA